MAVHALPESQSGCDQLVRTRRASTLRLRLGMVRGLASVNIRLCTTGLCRSPSKPKQHAERMFKARNAAPAAAEIRKRSELCWQRRAGTQVPEALKLIVVHGRTATPQPVVMMYRRLGDLVR